MANQAESEGIESIETSVNESTGVNPNSIPNANAMLGGEVDEQPTDKKDVPEKTSTEAKEVKKADGVIPGQGEVAAATAYTPNYKFKAYDKEHEFPKWLQESIKSKEHEDELRTIHAKAYALDELKEKYTKVQEYRNKYETVEKNISKLEKHLNAGDVDSFFAGLGFDEKKTVDMLSRYVMDKLNYKEMDEDSRRKYDQSLLDKRKSIEYEDELKNYKTRLEEYEIRQLDSELGTVLNEPEISEIIKIYDERSGTPGSFREQVIKLGDEKSRLLGRIVSPREIVSDFANQVKRLVGPVNHSAPQNTFTNSEPARQKPVIPNIQGKSTSPAKKSFRSIEDVEKYNADRWGI